ncbi:MAG: hydantoinase B/oxoprolinase family protein [Parasphingopyxis sp.]|uniref:hydantoinase B/oxoprolinase family protein n=1 Tax=Parasphingopyxis sp. TaxID=1920299 RepID=UPI0032ED72CC
MIPGSERFATRPIGAEELLRSLPSKLKVHTVDQRTVDELDPLTYEVVRHRLCSVTDEMGETLKRMSGSPIVTDANDFDFTINDEVGDLVQVGLYNTMLVGAIDFAAKWTLMNRAENPGIEEGDMFLCNDPWVGGGLHQNDVVVIQPIFHEGQLFGWTSAVCHEPDLGGSAIGSAPIGDVDVFSESVPTPPVKIMRQGVLQQDVADLWVRRSRVPMIVGLDLRAKIGANTTGRKRLADVIAQYGPDTVKAVMKKMMNDAESRLREKLRKAPDGSWTVCGYQDQAFEGDRETHTIKLTMTKADDRLIFDFEGTDPQRGVISCTLGGCRGGIMLAFLPMLCGDIPWSAGGLMRCFEIRAPEGTLVNATFPAALNRAPISSGWMVGNLTAQCLSQMLDREFDFRNNVQASCCGTFDFACVAGMDERPEEPVPFLNVVMETVAGGYGARPTKDGIDTGGTFCIPMGRVPDAEMTELLYPLLMLWRREEVDSGGPGKYRGGASCSLGLTPHGTSLPAGVVMSSSGKATAQNTGLAGGYPGNLGYDVIVHGAGVGEMLANGELPVGLEELGGDVEIAQCFAESLLHPGDVLYLNCQGGGGYGDPLLRDPTAVATDLHNGLISRQAAEDIYGVVVSAGGTVDQEATDVRRVDIRGRRRQEMVTNSPLSEKAEGGQGRAIDENLVLLDAEGGSRIACRHCGQILSADDHILHVGVFEGHSSTAGPGVRVAPDFFVDTSVAFSQLLCPECCTALDSAIGPSGETKTVNGFAIA